MIQINQHRSFSKKSDYNAFATVRVHNTLLRELGGRNAWICLESSQDTVYRTIRGSGSITPFPEDAIELDYDTSVELGVHTSARVDPQVPEEEEFFKCDLKIRPLKRREMIKAHWYHPDPAYRIPLQISIVLGSLSVILGIIGAILGILSITGV